MDIGKLLKSLNEHEVRYVIIGAAAFTVHGWSRTTHDIDIFFEASPENAKRLRKAMADFGYDMTDVTVEEMLKKKILVRQYVVAMDTHPDVLGAEFESVWRDRVDDKLYDVPTHFASLDDLIRMKRATGRPKDKEDLKYLLHLRKLLKEKKRKKRTGKSRRRSTAR